MNVLFLKWFVETIMTNIVNVYLQTMNDYRTKHSVAQAGEAVSRHVHVP